ncbi:GNAT family N-acetyltransferase [Verrucomicrobium sp. BvORR106]|uniref:GNAT family N-acetyltransferase n=1 Tax=Verrucomicrobium sp. BvORR106 TaxID=1403819 RepID=UPI000571C402|nr:GNAT family N-acetyltransferase [Verrucomicrobium sp. BvORR106]
MNLSHLPTGLVVREYTPDDKEACLDIYRSNEDLLPPDLIEAYADWLDIGTSYMLVIEQGGEVLACGGLEIDGSKNSNQINCGLVRRSHHRKGLGTLLNLTRLALVPQDHDPAFVGMETSVSNEPFFNKFGFERLNKPVSRYAGASYFLDMGMWLPASQKQELLTLLKSLPVDFRVDFEESMAGAAEGEEEKE